MPSVDQYPLKATTDVRTALARALVDYLKPLEFTVPAHATSEGATNYGKPLKFAKVFYEWPEQEKQLDLPALSIAPGKANYDAANITPVEVPDSRWPEDGDGYVMLTTSEAIVPLQIDIWTAHPSERRAIAMMVPGLFEQADGYTGLRLSLGDYYYSQIGSYTFEEYEFIDEGDAAQKRTRRLMMRVEARAPVVVLKPVYDLRIRIDSEINSVDEGSKTYIQTEE